MYLLVVYVPETHTAALIEALAEAGAGSIGDYDRCAWSVLGQGQFRPLAGANPTLGRAGELERVAEHRVEMVVEKSRIKAVLQALVDVHLYEEPAHHVIEVMDRRDFL
ncbi:NGG1p interacting factor 3 protein, NIF3 [Saccharospirillum impatiens]|uniref:NGG1p interacting factor 3 protein, NIF3 n=1 Tax=Saccharospirillum impatiens TaxID=169438 RepID=UPI0004151A59|nr:NGG1p interacting factor 3 protein, NIF3 [Saccharospirillum impatiens]